MNKIKNFNSRISETLNRTKSAVLLGRNEKMNTNSVIILYRLQPLVL
jgi:hypothetical protein